MQNGSGGERETVLRCPSHVLVKAAKVVLRERGLQKTESQKVKFEEAKWTDKVE